MATLAGGPGTLTITLWIAGGLIVLAILAGFVARALYRRGKTPPFVVRLINRTSDRVVDAVKKPVTIAVLDEVADVVQAGSYTRNIAAALRENHAQLSQMVSEKILADRSTRRVGLLPFHDRVINDVTETALRIVFEVLADPRTDELISDLVRDNISQLREAVRKGET
jgi:hypothetical protein